MTSEHRVASVLYAIQYRPASRTQKPRLSRGFCVIIIFTMVRVEQYLNTTQEEVEKKVFNIWIAISLGNQYFTKERIKAYIEWALEHTKEKVLVVVSDVLQAINIEVLDNRSLTSALKRAVKLGDLKYSEVKDTVAGFSSEQQGRVEISRWEDIANTERYRHNLQIIKDEYIHNKDFQEHIRDIVKKGRQDRIERINRLKEQELDRLCEYTLSEIPIFVDGTQMQNTIYTLIPYPGITKLDELLVGLQNGTLFPEIAEKLHITNKIAILDAYAS